MGAKTIKIFLADGTADGLRIIEVTNWNGVAIDCPRAEWPTAKNRSEFSAPGMYVLQGRADDGTETVYIGEADDLRVRITQHYAKLDNWTRVVAFTSKDKVLNKAHVRYLESRLVDIAHKSQRAKMLNGNVPAAASLSEFDRADAEAFLEQMLVLYPLIGVRAFDLPKPAATGATLLRLKGRGIEARGQVSPEGFLVLKGSRAALSEVPSLHTYVSVIRKKMLEHATLVPAGASLELAVDYAFESPSTAGAVMLGRTTNGRTAWKDEAGRTLREIEEAAASASG